jgi:hypothetical protein
VMRIKHITRAKHEHTPVQHLIQTQGTAAHPSSTANPQPQMPHVPPHCPFLLAWLQLSGLVSSLAPSLLACLPARQQQPSYATQPQQCVLQQRGLPVPFASLLLPSHQRCCCHPYCCWFGANPAIQCTITASCGH